MVYSLRATLLISLVTFLLILGCSGGSGNSPTTPGLNGTNLTAETGSKFANSAVIWEIGEVIINPETGTAEVIPLRTADFSLNIVKFLQPPAGSLANLSVVLDNGASNYAGGYVELDCTLTHPFPGSNFWGFDTRVIVIGAGSTVGKHDNTLRYPTASELRMVNADGYTRWWNRDEFAPFGKLFGYTDGALSTGVSNPAIVNGFKYFATGVGVNNTPANPPASGRGSLPTGAVTRRFKIQFSTVAPMFKYRYSVGSNWEAPTVSPPSTANDFPAAANQQEAYQVVVTQNLASTAFYNPVTHEFGGDLILDVEIWDWQSAGSPANQITAIYFESPTLLSNQGNVVDVKPIWTQSAGSSPNSVKYSGTFTNVAPTAVTKQELFVTVVSAGGATYQPPVPGFLYPSAPLAAYQLFPATILDSGTPTKTIHVTYPNGGEVFEVGTSESITWTSSGPITNVVIEYSVDGGVTYPNVIAANATNTGNFLWNPIPNTPTALARVRITEAGPTPTAQDASDNNFTISAGAEPGWNPIPGKIGLPVNNPAPNQSTVTPDLGIQNDDAGNEGAWMMDQQGTTEFDMMFYDYNLDWSGPGGEAYPSGFNMNFAPMGRFDVNANGLAVFGFSENLAQTAPPVINDPINTIWFISYLEDDPNDPGVDPPPAAGELFWIQWGDEGSGDPGNPPENDPDAAKWIRTMDTSGGLYGQDGDPTQYVQTWVNGISNDPLAPPVPLHGDGTPAEGDLDIGWWIYPFLDSSVWRLPIRDYTTDLVPPLFQAFNVTDKTKVRLAADTDSHLTFEATLPNTAILVHLIDSLGRLYFTGVQLDDTVPGEESFWYIGLTNSLKIFPTDPLYVAGGTAVDLECLPYIQWSADPDAWNWVAVGFDMGNNTYVIRVYQVDWTAATGEEFTVIDTTDPVTGTLVALDVDMYNFHIHCLAKNGSAYQATIFQYIP